MRASRPQRRRAGRRPRAQARPAAGARARHAGADPRQLSGRGVARRAAVLRASAQPLLAAPRRACSASRWPTCPTASASRGCRRVGSGCGTRSSPASAAGSLDGAIRNAERGEIARVRRVAPALALVCFNGKTAARAEPRWRAAGLRDARAAVDVAGVHPAARREARRVAGDRRLPPGEPLTLSVARARTAPRQTRTPPPRTTT